MASPLYKGVTVCNENLTVTFARKKVYKAKQCWMIGFTVLELSKLTMMRLYYEHLQPAVGLGNITTVMSDTDSFLVCIQGKDADAFLKSLGDVMDFSNYPADHPLFSDAAKKLPGYLKNEMPGMVIIEVVALKSKSYAFR